MDLLPQGGEEAVATRILLYMAIVIFVGEEKGGEGGRWHIMADLLFINSSGRADKTISKLNAQFDRAPGSAWCAESEKHLF